ncbi:hypothetical protein IL306_006325 [Fusarium sp. DS 682]|nr:hypothetical protein IL306_006325 [Fusarium sp. DS 682]
MRSERCVSKENMKNKMSREGKSQKQFTADVKKVLARIRAGYSAWFYMHRLFVNAKLKKIVNGIREQFAFAESVYNKRYPNEQAQLADLWIEWISDYYTLVYADFKESVPPMVAEIRAGLKGDTSDLADMAERVLQKFERDIGRNGFLPAVVTEDWTKLGKEEDTEMGGT